MPCDNTTRKVPGFRIRLAGGGAAHQAPPFSKDLEDDFV